MKEETHRFWSIIIQAVTVLGVLYGVFSGLSSWTKSLQLELLGVFWTKRVEAHIDAASAAAILASGDVSSDVWRRAETKFWELYNGRLAVVEDSEVCTAMVDFRNVFIKYKAKPVGGPTTQTDLKRQALKLSKAIRNSLRRASQELKPIAAEHTCN